MIPRNDRNGTVIDGLPGERQQFTIAANGKAFRVLIDGLYSNKIRSVTREIWSNALDSHIQAGCPEKPFMVSVPTSLDPTFRVRDFGVSLSHQDVMHLYTTIFESTKEGSNDVTGMLGLGSKSPFAYTDSFSVVAYKDGEKRVYIAATDETGLPSITHISTEYSDEPQGIEVSFPCQRYDMESFKREAQWVSLGFTVKPIMDGMDLKMPVARLSGDNWAIYPNGSFGDIESRSLIRQGCVCYPNNSLPVPGLAQSWTTIVDVPIGTANVTASREALQYDDSTREAIREIVNTVGAKIRADVQVEIDKAVTRREKATVALEFNGVFSNQIGKTTVSLIPDIASGDEVAPSWVGAVPGESLEVADRFGQAKDIRRRRGYYGNRSTQRFVSAIEVSVLDKITILVDDHQKMVRKRVRIQPEGPLSFVCPIEGVEWVTECLELKPEQFRSIHDLADPGPDEQTRERAAVVKKVLAPGQYWMVRMHGVTQTVWGHGHRNDSYGCPRGFHQARQFLDDVAIRAALSNVLFITEKQAEKMKLPEARRYDTVIQNQLTKEAKRLPVAQALEAQALRGQLYGVQEDVIVEQFFPHLKSMTSQEAQRVLDKARYAGVDTYLLSQPITDKVNVEIRALTATYPLLFGKTDKAFYTQYIKAVQNSMTQTQEEEAAA